jgi:hypothetical protein
MAMERENYYLMLELPIDPPTEDPGEIRSAIHRKKQEWTRWQDHPGKRAQGLANLAALPDLEQVMFDPVARKREACKALKLREEMMLRFEAELRILEGKGHLLPREVSALAAKYRVYGVTQKKIHELVRVPVSEEPPTPEEPELPGEVLDRLTAKTIARNLNVLGIPDLYAFLGEPPYSSIKKLRAAAEQKRRIAASEGKTAASVATQELAGICLRLFESFDTKQLYDRYLRISSHPALGEMIDEEFVRARYISPVAMMRLVNFAVETCGMRVLEAEDYIRRYCAAYQIPTDVEKPLISCPACEQQVGQSSVVCPTCAAPLKGNCPACGTHFEDGAPVCFACGFLLKDMVKALPYLDAAQGAIIDRSWSTALRGLAYVEKYWPGHPEIAPLKARAKQLEERYAWYVDQMSDCMGKNQYYAALDLIHRAGEERIRLPAATVRQVEKVIENLEQQLAALSAQPNPDVERLMELSGTVTDSLELTRLLNRHPPLAPRHLKASLEGRQVRLGWTTSNSPGKADYVLVRKQGCVPYTAFDGDVLYEGPANSFVDQTAPALKEVYYRVFARRGNVFSPDGAHCGPILIIPEIEDLRILPADQGAQLFWAVNPDLREVRIWRKLGGERPTAPGEGVLIQTNRIDGFMDTKIKNDVDYWYYLVAVYSVDGREVVSKGVCAAVTPHRILAPVERLTIAKSSYGENEFVVNWGGGDYPDLLLLASPKKPDLKPGEILPVQELLGRYRNLSLHARTTDSGRFRYSFLGGVYIFAAIPFGKFAAVGAPEYLTNLQEVRQLAAGVVGEDLCLNMRWPMGLNQIAVAWRTDDYPKSMEEPGTHLLQITREQYDYDAGVILRGMGTGSYYFRVYSLFSDADGAVLASEGVTLAYQNLPRQEIFYRFAYRRKMLKGKAELVLTLSGPEAFVLPPAAVLLQTERLPLSRSDGEILLLLDQEARVDGEVLFQYEIDPLPPNAHLRLFFGEDAPYQRFRLLSASQLKLT